MKESLLFLLLLVISYTTFSKDYSLTSPDGKLKICISASSQGIYYSFEANGENIISKSNIGMSVNGGTVKFGPSKDFKVKQKKVDQIITAFAYKNSKVKDIYNSITLSSKLYGVEFRVYDTGMAYRFTSDYDGDIVVDSEIAEFNFAKDYDGYIPLYSNFPDNNAQESLYKHTKISMVGNTVMMTPLLLDIENGHKLLITESDLRSYPGMELQNSINGLVGVFPKYPSELVYKNNVRHVNGRENYIAKTVGKRTFPWRIIAYAEKDIDLPSNDMVYCLASENIIGDTSWIIPGKSAWEWWSDNTVASVDFKVGINTETYKYYIDFAKEYGLEYIILDGEWSYSPLKPKPEVNIEEIARYAKENGIGVILWTFSNLFYDDMENICRHYSEMGGISGFKIDFFDRDDQLAIEMAEKIAATTAKYHMIADFHGFCKPTGLNRTYPNVLGFEGVFGLENYKWYGEDIVSNELLLPFIRLVAGPVDYTPGAMLNATMNNYRPICSAPMSQGTRAHQVAFYIVLDAPFGILADGPYNYIKEKETTSYITRIPTTFEKTISLQGEVGEYYVSARKKGNKWFVGGINSWNPRDLSVKFDFLDPQKVYKAEIFKDGVNADKYAMDYFIESREMYVTDCMNIHMAPGGGFSIILTELEK